MKNVKVGNNVTISHYTNLYGCELGDDVFIGPFVEIQKNCKIGHNTRISSHSFICEGVEDGKLIKVHVGSGITDDQRTEYWKNRKKLKGMVVEIMADAVTKNQSDDDTYSLRFPRFVRFRGFEAGEKI
jgi:carbonic anhydrase/acetyltransferase-like protein (isoleucine patch superfamily)